MNTRRAESLIRFALREGGSGVLFPAEPAGGGPTPVTGKAQSGGTLLPAYNANGVGTTDQNIKSFQSAEMKGGLDRLKKAQDEYRGASGGGGAPAWAPWSQQSRRAWGDNTAGAGGGAPSAGGSAPAARPPSLPYSGTTFPSAPRGGGRSNVGSMSRSEHVEVRGGGGSAAPAGGGRGASRITERATASIVMRPLDEGNPYVTQPGNTPYNGGGAPSPGGTLLRGEPAGGSFGGGGPTAPRPGNTGSMGGGGGGVVGGVLSSVGNAVLNTAGRAVGQAIQGNGKVDYAGMARNVGGYAAGTAVNGLARSATGAMGGGSSR